MRDWWDRRRRRRAQQEAAMQQLREEYGEKLKRRDPDALEAARDYGDHDLVPRRMEAGMALVGVGMLCVYAIIALLILFFTWIKDLTGG